MNDMKPAIIKRNAAFAGSFRVSLLIDSGCPSELETGWRRGVLSLYDKRSGLQGSNWWKFGIWNVAMGN